MHNVHVLSPRFMLIRLPFPGRFASIAFTCLMKQFPRRGWNNKAHLVIPLINLRKALAYPGMSAPHPEKSSPYLRSALPYLVEALAHPAGMVAYLADESAHFAEASAYLAGSSPYLGESVAHLVERSAYLAGAADHDAEGTAHLGERAPHSEKGSTLPVPDSARFRSSFSRIAGFLFHPHLYPIRS